MKCVDDVLIRVIEYSLLMVICIYKKFVWYINVCFGDVGRNWRM